MMIKRIANLVKFEPVFYQVFPKTYEDLTMSATVMLSDVEYFGMEFWRG